MATTRIIPEGDVGRAAKQPRLDEAESLGRDEAKPVVPPSAVAIVPEDKQSGRDAKDDADRPKDDANRPKDDANRPKDDANRPKDPGLNHLQVKLESALAESYVRTRHNNLRCFPRCSPFHMEQRFCGRAVDVSVLGASVADVPRLFVFAEFRNSRTPSTFPLGIECTKQSLVALGDRIMMAEYVRELNGALRFVIHPPRKWHYPGKIRSVDCHALQVYLSVDGRLNATCVSSLFYVKPIWRSEDGKEERKPARGEAVVEKGGSASNVMASTPRGTGPDHNGENSKSFSTTVSPKMMGYSPPSTQAKSSGSFRLGYTANVPIAKPLPPAPAMIMRREPNVLEAAAGVSSHPGSGFQLNRSSSSASLLRPANQSSVGSLHAPPPPDGMAVGRTFHVPSLTRPNGLSAMHSQPISFRSLSTDHLNLGALQRMNGFAHQPKFSSFQPSSSLMAPSLQQSSTFPFMHPSSSAASHAPVPDLGSIQHGVNFQDGQPSSLFMHRMASTSAPFGSHIVHMNVSSEPNHAQPSVPYLAPWDKLSIAPSGMPYLRKL